MILITIRIEIAAPPLLFLDFQSLRNYSPNGFFKDLSGATGKVLGDTMRIVRDGAMMNPILLENSEQCFRWRETFPSPTFPLFDGKHAFQFLASDEFRGGTTFVHEECFSGVLGFMMGTNFLAGRIGVREKMEREFRAYNKDLKKWCEGEEM